MKEYRFQPSTVTSYSEQKEYVKLARKAGFCTQNDVNVIHGIYSNLKGDERNIAYTEAEQRLLSYRLTVDNIAFEKMIACYVCKYLEHKNSYDIHQIFNDGSRFEALCDTTNERVSGTFEITSGWVRIVFDTKYSPIGSVYAVRGQYLEQQNNEIKADDYDKSWLLTFEDLHSSQEHVDRMMELWFEKNPMPTVTDLGNFEQAMEKAYWSLRCQAATYFFYEGKECGLHIPAYRWNIQQAIINRKDSQHTMLAAALEYVENLTANLP